MESVIKKKERINKLRKDLEETTSLRHENVNNYVNHIIRYVREKEIEPEKEMRYIFEIFRYDYKNAENDNQREFALLSAEHYSKLIINEIKK